MSQKISRRRAGYTLIEIMTATASSTVLMAGMASSVYIASRSLDVDSDKRVQRTKASEIVDQMLADAQHALNFTARSSTEMEFTVPDRTGDGQPETLRYAWGGEAGDPLTLTTNGVTVALAVDIQSLDLSYTERFIVAP